jgi:hypothetical protein
MGSSGIIETMMMIALYLCALLAHNAFAGVHGVYRTKEGKTLEVWQEASQSRVAFNGEKQIICRDTACYFAYQHQKRWHVFNVDAIQETLQKTGLSALLQTYMDEAGRQLKKADIQIVDTGEPETVGNFSGRRYQVRFKRGGKTHEFFAVATQEKLPLEAQKAILHIAERAGTHVAKENFFNFWAALMKRFDAQQYAVIQSDAFSLVEVREQAVERRVFKLPAEPEMPFSLNGIGIAITP